MYEIIEKIITDDILSTDFEVKVKSGHHYNYGDRKVPSVTTILNHTINEDYIATWANYLGFRRLKYKDELEKAANIGTMGHNAIEDYVMNSIESTNMCLQSFLVWWNDLNATHNVEVIGMEQRMITPYCGGTYDMLLKIDGRIYLVDFKTSNHLHYKYFIQLAQYKNMIKSNFNMDINGCLILQLDKKKPMYHAQALNFDMPDDIAFINQCSNTFYSLVLAYYNTSKTETEWNSRFSSAYLKEHPFDY